MRRKMTRAMTVLGLLLPVVAYSMAAGAQPKKARDAGAPKSASSADASGSGSAPSSDATGTASPSASSASDSKGAGSTGSTGASAASGTSSAPAPAVSVDMTGKAADQQPMTGGTYAVRLRDLEQRVDELKDQIRRSHTRLALLSDTILGGGAAGCRAEVQLKNEMSSAFLLIRALVVVDGQVQYNRQDDSGALADQKEIPVYSGSIPPGDHTIQVALTFQGNGFGVFSYLRGYKFEVKASQSFTAVEGKALTETATVYEKGGATTPLEQRPAVQWQEKIQQLTAGAASGGTHSSATPSPSGPTGSASVGATGNVSVGGAAK